MGFPTKHSCLSSVGNPLFRGGDHSFYFFIFCIMVDQEYPHLEDILSEMSEPQTYETRRIAMIMIAILEKYLQGIPQAKAKK